MDQLTTGTEVGLGPGDIVLDGEPAPPPAAERAQHPPTFRPMSIVAKRSPISATAELPKLKLYSTAVLKIQCDQCAVFHRYGYADKVGYTTNRPTVNSWSSNT